MKVKCKGVTITRTCYPDECRHDIRRHMSMVFSVCIKDFLLKVENQSRTYGPINAHLTIAQA